MKYKTYKVVGGGEVVRRIPENDEDRAICAAEIAAGKATTSGVWTRKEREEAYRYGLKLEAEKKKAEEEAARAAEK